MIDIYQAVATVREIAEKYNVSLRASSGYFASAAYAAGSRLPHAPGVTGCFRRDGNPVEG